MPATPTGSGALLAELTSLGMPGLLLRFSALAVIAWLALRTLDQGKGSVEAGYGNRDVLREKFAVQLASWQAKYPLEKLLEGRKLEAPPPDWKEEDVYDYGAERVLVVDDDALVDFFVLNDFHAQQRCPPSAPSGRRPCHRRRPAAAASSQQ